MCERIKPIAIKELLDKKFFIPSYQRGYRWEDLQVKELIEDIKDFIINGSKGIYCIQPLVVKKHGGEWEVVDGQQRLTTINIFLSCLEHEKYSLRYATRKGSAEYLDQISDDAIRQKYEDNIDYYHMYNAYQEARRDLPQKDDDKSEFCKTLLEKVKFIWYNIQDDDAIETFTRLNIDKISLTSSELVKALLLNRTNFDDIGGKHIHQKQQEIASEWDSIENDLQKDEFWLFFHAEGYANPTRIDYLMKIISDRNLMGIDVNEEYIGTDDARIFRYFYKYFHDKDSCTSKEEHISVVWKRIKDIYSTLMEWYSDVRIYHYIGYIMCQPHKNKSDKTEDYMQSTLYALIEKWCETGMTRDKFVEHLIGEIKETLKGCANLDYEYGDSGEKKKDCRPLLLLHNVQTVINQNLKVEDKYDQKVFNRFPFNLFKMESWDVEHIDSLTTNDLENLKDQRDWLTTNYFLAEDDVKKEIKDFMRRKWIAVEGDDEDIDKKRKAKFREIKEAVERHSEASVKNRLDEEKNEKNMIWNYAFLDSSTNRGYKNAIFPMKRLCIIQKDQGMRFPQLKVEDLENPEWNGRLENADSSFIPPCTKQAFMKYYSSRQYDITSWTRDDAKAYKRNIYETLRQFNVTTNEQ